MLLSPIVDHNFFINVTADQHHAQSHKARHQKDGADDLESLLCLANFSEKSHASLTNVTADQHHAQAHTLASHSTKAHSELTGVTASQHHTKTVASELNLADMAEKSHASLTNVTADQHHAQAHTLASHSTKAHSELTGILASQHHAKYTNAEAVAAAEAEDPFDHVGAVNIGGPLGIGITPLDKVEVAGNALINGTLDSATFEDIRPGLSSGTYVINISHTLDKRIIRDHAATNYPGKIPFSIRIVGGQTDGAMFLEFIITGIYKFRVSTSAYSIEDVSYKLLDRYLYHNFSINSVTATSQNVISVSFDYSGGYNFGWMAYVYIYYGVLAHLYTGIVFNLGLATVGTKQAQALISGTFTISKVKIYADTAPTGASILVDVNKNGVTIFTTQANRPEIAIAGHAADSGVPDVTGLVEGDRVSVDIDQVGSTIPGGSDLLVTIIC